MLPTSLCHRLFLTVTLTLTCAIGAGAYEVNTLATGLDKPWSVAELPSGQLLVSEKTGRLLMLARNGEVSPITGIPAVYYANQGGLLEVLPHPEFATNNLVYLSYAGGDSSANRTTVVRGVLSGTALTGLETILEVAPDKEGPAHYGGKMAFLPDGTLLLSVGEGFKYRERAQDLDWELGKLLRVNADGSAPADNPFPERAPRVYSYGHRNPQGLLYDAATDRILMHEHGPKGGDELNVIRPGNNYGWPAITYGVDYSGAMISPFTEQPGMEQPIKYWVPSIAPAGMTLYNADMFPQWKGSLLIAAMVPGDVRRIEIQDNNAVNEEVLFSEFGRIRNVAVAPDGSVILATDGANGKLIRVSAKGLNPEVPTGEVDQ